MTPADVLSVILMCAPNVAPSTLQAIVDIESHGNPYAIHINDSDVYLTRAPSSPDEAVQWAQWLRTNGYNFDAGLGQVNSANFDRLGITPENAFQPCVNIRAAGQILTDNYRWALTTKAPGADALLAAVSAYNTGNLKAGFHNGYVRNFVNALAAEASGVSVLPSADQAQTHISSPPLVHRAATAASRVVVAKAAAHAKTTATTADDATVDWQNPTGWQTPTEWGAQEITAVNSTTPRNP